MFNDSVMNSLVFHHVTKFAGGLVVVALWYWWYREAFKPYAQKAMAKDTSAVFPFMRFLAMIAVSCGFLYYVSMEGAFRQVPPVSQKASEPREIETRETSVPEYVSPADKLKATEEAMLKQNAEENAASKARFSELPAVRSNGTGGAEAAEPAKPAEATDSK